VTIQIRGEYGWIASGYKSRPKGKRRRINYKADLPYPWGGSKSLIGKHWFAGRGGRPYQNKTTLIAHLCLTVRCRGCKKLQKHEKQVSVEGSSKNNLFLIAPITEKPPRRTAKGGMHSENPKISHSSTTTNVGKFFLYRNAGKGAINLKLMRGGREGGAS